MKILHTVEFYNPSVGGAQEVVKQLSEHLVMLGHDVTVATTRLSNRKLKVINGVKIKEFSISGNQVSGMRGEVGKYKNFLVHNEFDIIMNYAAQQWTTDIFFEVIDLVRAKKILFPCGFSGLKQEIYNEYYNNMKYLIPKFDYVIFTSKEYQDYKFALQLKLKNIKILPNGASEAEFKETLPSDDIKHKLRIPNGKTLILIGSHTGAKGHLESINILKKLKTKNISLVIVGHKSNEGCFKKCLKLKFKVNRSLFRLLDHKLLIICSLNRPDTVNLLKQSDALLFPSQVECSPLVIYEAMAAGTPFFSTDVGNVRNIALTSNGGVILPTITNGIGRSYPRIKESARLIDKTLSNSKLLTSMGRNGRAYWKRNNRWSKILQKYHKLILTLKTNELN